jgi:L,D-peptidoglycan transpeptidase YkuD (ErfK/YbiS/YcfS/YnhG family)
MLAAAATAVALCRPVGVPAGSRQLVSVEAPSRRVTVASLRLWRRSGSCFRLVAGPWRARLGWNGLSARHREGDGTTPTGVYGFGPVVYGLAPDPGVRYRYHRLTCGDWWDEDPASSTYNTFRHLACGARPSFRGGSEALWTETRAYQQFAVIAYNDDPVVPGRGSAVFLHDDLGGPTNGCVSLPQPQLLRLLRWLDPRAAPRISIRALSAARATPSTGS